MKKSLLFFAICFLALQTVDAQFKLGLKGGFSTTDINPSELFVTNSDQVKDLGIAVNEAGYGVHMGFFAQLKIRNFIIQPELLFNSNSVEYRVTDFNNGENVESFKTESYQNVDMPILFGVKKGWFRFMGGPVAHVHIGSNSELFDIDGYDQKFEDMTWGYQTGVGLDIGSFMLDVRYEGSFDKFGDHMTINNQDINFDQSKGRMVASIGIKF